METKNYTVYMHKNKLNGKIYIGITGREPYKRWMNGRGYKDTYFGNAIKKYGWDNFEHIILMDGLSKEEAEKMEIKLISEYDSTNKSKGYNISLGGSGSESLSEETKLKISNANKGRYIGEKNPLYGKPRPKEVIDAIKLSNGKPVYQYDRKTGDFISEYPSAAEAGRVLGINHANISAVCNRGVKSIGGFIFRYKEEGLEYGAPLPKEDFEENKNTHLKPVLQFDLNNNFIKRYNSIKDAEKEIANGKRTAIWHCCNGKKKTACGSKWKYEDA